MCNCIDIDTIPLFRYAINPAKSPKSIPFWNNEIGFRGVWQKNYKIGQKIDFITVSEDLRQKTAALSKN